MIISDLFSVKLLSTIEESKVISVIGFVSPEFFKKLANSSSDRISPYKELSEVTILLTLKIPFECSKS